MAVHMTYARHLKAFAFAILGAVLVWQVVTGSLAAYLAGPAPETALSLAPGHSEALLNLADRKLALLLAAARPTGSAPDQVEQGAADTSQDAGERVRMFAERAGRALGTGEQAKQAGREADGSPAEVVSSDQIRAWAELALVNEPLNARALRILGQLAAIAKDEARANQFMEASARRSLHEKLPLYWLMVKNLERKNNVAAVYYADALLRTTPSSLPDVVPTLVYVMERTNAGDEVKARLAQNPPWRKAFLAIVSNHVSDPRTPLDLLLSLKDNPDPPTNADLRAYLDFLVSKNQYELAYYAWLQFLPSEQLTSVGLLFNGSFKRDPSGLPFDWVIASGAGVSTQIQPRPGQEDQRAVSIKFEQGRVEFDGVRQLLMLPPGTYQFAGKYRGEIVGRRGLRWRLLCGGTNALLGESPMLVGLTPIWRDVEFLFTIPDNCRAQQLRLDLDARSASERLVTGSIWLDEIKVSRVPDVRDK